MNISDRGVQFICGFEGFKAFPYQDVKGVWTIGFGTTFYPNRFRVTAGDMAVNEQQALECLRYHIDYKIAKRLNSLTNQCQLTQNEFDALCSFVYNVGMQAFEQSTLLKDIRKMIKSYYGSIVGSECGASSSLQECKWDADIITGDFLMCVKSGGMLVSWLVKRRKAEAELFLGDSGV